MSETASTEQSTELSTAPAEAEVQETVSEAKPEDTYTQRLRTDPDFAVQEAKKAQAEVRRVKQKLGSVEQVVDAVGGADALLGHLRRLNTIVSNPAMRTLVEQFEQTGTLPAIPKNGEAKEAEEFEEPWDKSVRQKVDPVAQELQSLKAEVSRLRGDNGVKKVQEFFREFRKEFDLPDEEWADFTDKMGQQAKQWAGNPQGLTVLETLDYQNFRALGLGKLTKPQIKAALEREAQASRAEKAALATDSPSRVGTTGREKPVGMSPLEAFLEGCRREGVAPDSFHRLIKH